MFSYLDVSLRRTIYVSWRVILLIILHLEDCPSVDTGFWMTMGHIESIFNQNFWSFLSPLVKSNYQLWRLASNGLLLNLTPNYFSAVKLRPIYQLILVYFIFFSSIWLSKFLVIVKILKTIFWDLLPCFSLIPQHQFLNKLRDFNVVLL